MAEAITTSHGVRRGDESLVARRRWSAPFAAVVFSVCLSTSVIVGTVPDIHDSAAHTLDQWSESTTKVKAFVAWALAVIAVLMLVWFLVEVVKHLRRFHPDHSIPLSVLITGSILATTLTVASAVRAAPVGDLVMDSEKRAGNAGKLTPAFADFARETNSLYDWMMFFGFGLGAAALVICVSLSAHTVRALPRPVEWSGYVIAPILPFIAFFNLILLMAWVIVVGIVIARRTNRLGALAPLGG
jgi:uncharacterized membrane protein YgcG